MPAKSKAQQRLMAIAKHSPEKVQSENKGVLKMKAEKLSEYVETPTKKLPEKKLPENAPKKELSVSTPKYKVLNKLQPAASKAKKKAKAKATSYLVMNKLKSIMEGKGTAFLKELAENKNKLFVGEAAKDIQERKDLNKKYLKK